MAKEQAGPKYSDLKRRFFFLIGALVVFRIGSYIPIPGIDFEALRKLMDNQGGLFDMLNLFSGGSLSRFSVFALGIMPYISSSIIIQLMTSVVPSLEALKKEGESGRKKIAQYTRYGTLLLAIGQSFFLIGLATSGEEKLVTMPMTTFMVTAVICFTTGTMFLMWLGEQITERGIGNGISLIIFAGIVVGLPGAISSLIGGVNTGSMSAFSALIVCAIVALVTGFVVFVERGQRRILVNYAKRQVGNKLYGGQSSHVPLKLNMSGVMPAIFASSLMMFLSSILQFITKGKSSDNIVINWVLEVQTALSHGQLGYTILFAAMIIFFCFFYTALVFNPKEMAENLKKSGAFVPGIRPGQQTGSYLGRVMTRLTLAGALYITLICLLPDFMMANWDVQFYFGGTSLLIIVVVTMDFMSQVQATMMSYQYESLLKKTNFRGSMTLR